MLRLTEGQMGEPWGLQSDVFFFGNTENYKEKYIHKSKIFTSLFLEVYV
jgi:hypothetical protein